MIDTYEDDVQAALDRAAVQWGPLTCAVFLSSPLPSDPLVRVERYGPRVAVRYRWTTGADVVRELPQVSEAAALREYARQVALVQARGFRPSATVVSR